MAKGFVVFALCAVFAISALAYADSAAPKQPIGSPVQFVEARISDVFHEVEKYRENGGRGEKELMEDIKKRMVPYIRPRRTGQSIAGKHWRVWTESQRAEFVETLSGYLLCTYIGKLIEHANAQWYVVSSSQPRKTRARVSVLFRVKSEEHGKKPETGHRYTFKYFLRRDGDGKTWWIYNMEVSSGLSFNFVIYLRNQVSRLLLRFLGGNSDKVTQFEKLIRHYKKRTDC